MSSKKPFEYIEDKIKQAAENNLPAFDERAWAAMNAKLDQQEKKRRPFFLWWIMLLLVLTGGLGAYKFLYHSANTDQHAAPVVQANTAGNSSPLPPAAATTATNADSKTEHNTVAANDKTITDKPAAITPASTNTASPEGAPTLPATNSKVNGAIAAKAGKKHINTGSAAMDQLTSGNDISAVENKPTKKNKRLVAKTKARVSTAKGLATEEDAVTNADATLSAVAAEKEVSPKEKVATTKLVTTAVVQQKESGTLADSAVNGSDKKKITAATEKKSQLQKKQQSTLSQKGFYLLATAGPDAGSVKLFSYSNSSFTPRYGLGLGYQFSNRFSVQTGFYAVNKKYIAFKGDYHAKPGSYWDRVDILKVKAACLVYEIPLTVRYDVLQRRSFSLYAAAGMSSYIMQKEDYDYYYNAYNSYHEKEVEYTGNKHLFSTLSFSVGIEKKLSTQFSILLEPALSLPVKGVGDGKVNLYSSSLQLGARYFFNTTKK